MLDPSEDVSEESLSSGGLWLVTAVSLGLLVYCLRFRPAGDPFSPLSIASALAVVGLEVSAPAAGAVGFFSASAIPLWILIGLPGVGPGAAAFVFLVALVLRTLARQQLNRAGWCALAADLFPAMVLCAAHKLWLAPAAYLVAWLVGAAPLLPALTPTRGATWSNTREQALPHYAALASICLLGRGWPALLAAVALQAAMRPIRFLEDAERVQKAELTGVARLDRARKDVAQTRAMQAKNAQELKAQLDTYTLLGEMLGEMSKDTQPGAASRRLLSMLRTRVPCQAMALFNGTEFFASHPQLHLDRAPDFVVDAWENGRKTVASEGLALPLPGWGVLALFDSQASPDSDQVAFLERLAPHLRLFIDSSRYYELQAHALQLEKELRAALQELLGRQTNMLELLSYLMEAREPDRLLQIGIDGLRGVLEFEHLVCSWKDLVKSTLDAPRTNAVLEWAAARPQARLESSPAGLDGTVRPLGQEGWMIVLSRDGQMRNNDHHEMLQLFSYQLATLLRNADLLRELEQALTDLKASQAQLVQSSKMAAVGNLAAGVAHELNTPLGAIAVGIDGALMALEKRPEKARERLEKASKSVNVMQDIVAKLLFYSRDDRTARVEVDISQVVEDTLQMTRNHFRLEQIQVEARCQPGPPVLANPTELQQVLTNLLLNARDAVLMPEAQARRVEVETTYPDGHAEIHVRDWGCGMPEEVAKRIFEPFYTTKPIGKGTGLGLSVSHELIRQHEGTLEVESEPGVGTTFRIRLPLHRTG